MKKIRIEEELLLKAVKESLSFPEVGERLGVSRKTATRMCYDKNINVSHFPKQKDPNEYIGEKSFLLTVLSVYKEASRTMCITECECGNTKRMRLDSFYNGKIKSCGCLTKVRKMMCGKNNPAFKGLDIIPISWFKDCKRNAVRRNIDWLISIEDVNTALQSQKFKCALSGEEIYFGRIRYRDETNASIDRIDSMLPYTPDNIQMVTKKMNVMKSVFTQEDFIQNCKIVAEYHSKE
jgi:hypothetical protein